MKKLIVFAVTFAAMGLVAGPAMASAVDGDPPCSYDSPFKAKGLKTSMVRAFASCGGSTTYPSPNSALGATNTDACTPSFALSAFSYGPKGSCSLKIGSKTADAQPIGSDSNKCFPDTTVDSCNITSLKVKCSDLLDETGLASLEEPDGELGGWYMNTFTRGTLDDRVNGGAHTAIDFPVTFYFPPAKKGKLKAKFSANAALFDLLQSGSALPQCSSLELLNIAIVDSSVDSGVFAVMGVATGGGN